MASDDWLHDERAIRRVHLWRDARIDDGAWPATVPAVAAFLEGARDGGWEFAPGVTFLVGENGSGKSTIVEALAEVFGLPPEGGTVNGGARTRPTESPLAEWLRIERGPGAPRWGFFLRAETMHGYYSYLDGVGPDGARLHEASHGESFNTLLEENSTIRSS